jgi:tetratricopeptide (TPR) repeat protein
MKTNDKGHTSLASGNIISGDVQGNIVQAASIAQLNINPGNSGYPAVPSQLPPPPRLFTGRNRELDYLDRSLADSDDQPLLIVLSGAGGVGKTTLAVRWLHAVRSRVSAGQLYVDLGAFSGQPVTPEDALGWFLLALGVAFERVPAGLAQRQALYRSLTADRSVAVLLDNALSAAQVRPLIPASAGSIVVVTSRWRLAGLRMIGARHIDVDPLDVTRSMELLDTLIGEGRLARERTEAEELARLCGGMPLALSLLGARLSARPRRTLSAELGKLRNTEHLSALAIADEVSLEAVFDTSYHELSQQDARTYRLCAVHRNSSFIADVAAAAVGQSVNDVEESLDALIERSLLTEIDDHLFRYHDLLHVHARSKADNNEAVPALRRIVDWYLDTVVAADLMLRPSRRRVGPRFQRRPDRSALFATQRDTLAWFEVERDNVIWAARSAIEHGWDALTWEFCEALWGFFLHTRNYDEWLELHRAGVPAAQRCGQPIAEARLRTQVGAALTELGQYNEAMEENLHALRLAEEHDDKPTVASALLELASAARGKSDLPGAMVYLGRAKALWEANGTERAVALCRRRIGEVMAELGRYDEAVIELQHAAETMKAIDKAQYARILTSLSSTHLRWGHTNDAMALLREALDLTRQLSSPYYQAEVLTTLADAAALAGDTNAARAYLSEAQQLCFRNSDPKATELGRRLAQLTTGSVDLGHAPPP